MGSVDLTASTGMPRVSQDVVDGINSSSTQAISATSKAVQGLTEIMVRLQPLLAMLVKNGKKAK